MRAERERPGAATAGSTRRERSRTRRWAAVHSRLLIGAAGLLLVAGAWQLCAGLHVVNPFFSSSPSQVVTAEIQYFQHGTGLSDVGTTAKEFLIGIAVSVVVGVPLGLAIGYYRFVSAACDPLISLLYQTPFVALAPVAILWFGIGLEAKVALAFAGSVSPVVIATSAGVRTVERSLLNVARVYRASDFQIFRTLILPGTIPSIVSGIRLGTGLALVGTIAVEMVASSSGLGDTIQAAGNAQQTSLMFAAIAVVSVFGMIVSIALRLIGQRVDQWRVM
jgi:ABC-type nitrate/sulfonate/bicarbonate transport system permease component